MRLNHIGKIKGNISINTKLKSANILDGAYRSIFKGKSLNFEELREYNVGDNVRDIDWRASARSMNLLVREYVADKKHNVLFVLDSRMSMNANANEKDLKRDIAIDTAGTLAYLAYKNGDYVGAVYMNNDYPIFFPVKQSLFNIENFLTCYDEDLKNRKLNDKCENSVNISLKYISNYYSKKSVIFLITDISGLEQIDENLLKTISGRNDIMVINIEDVSLFYSTSYDLENRKYFSSMFLKNQKLVQMEQEEKQKTYQEQIKKYAKYRITVVSVDKEENVIPKIIELLNKHQNIDIRK